MILGEPWTPAQDSFLCANFKLNSAELAKQVSQIGPARTSSAVRDRFRRLRQIGVLERDRIIKGWTEAEIDIVKAMYVCSDDGAILEALRRAGFTRTREGVTRARQRHGFIRTAEPEEREVFMGWHSAPGTSVERDRQFVRLVQAEALRLGLFKRDAA